MAKVGKQAGEGRDRAWAGVAGQDMRASWQEGAGTEGEQEGRRGRLG